MKFYSGHQSSGEKVLEWVHLLRSHKLLFFLLLLTGPFFFFFPLYVDRSAVQWMVQFRESLWFFFFQAVTRLGLSHYYLIASGIAFVLGMAGCRKCLRNPVFLFLSVALSGTIVNILKPLLGRSRPDLFLQKGIYRLDPMHFDYGNPDHYLWHSFPSGHAATALSVAVTMAIIYPTYRYFWLSLGLLVAVSRVVTMAHYPSDVWAGAMIGLFSSVLVRYWIMSRLRIE